MYVQAINAFTLATRTLICKTMATVIIEMVIIPGTINACIPIVESIITHKIINGAATECIVTIEDIITIGDIITMEDIITTEEIITTIAGTIINKEVAITKMDEAITTIVEKITKEEMATIRAKANKVDKE